MIADTGSRQQRSGQATAGLLEFRATTRRFDTVIAVDNVSLAIAPGTMVGIIGRSGAGKSTLLRLINRLVEPSEGQIRFNGREVTGLAGRDLRAWRSRCAMIFQQFNLTGRLDVLTNVLVGRLGHLATIPAILGWFSALDRAMAVQALDRLDMLDQAFQRVDTLSGGQQQRVAIARALVQKPALILADEPIASLDPRSATSVMQALRRINREDGITVLCNLHSLSAAREYCDRIVGMAAGRIVFDGPPESLTAAETHAIYGSSPDVEEGVGNVTAPHPLVIPPAAIARTA